ncbi:2'-5' RNA ligase family protein [Haloimpatiens sp. FM7330]|uniref:2'-5' RNA ligase family protein n=1 Tax=Haloimpatiens sp. FM7330 TaxID=3298610 RepID=UPI00363C5BFD
MNKIRFVIVCLIKKEPLKLHETLINQIDFKFGVKRQKLPAHFTIKAPFELENIDNVNELENLIENFCKNNHKQKIDIDGFNHFSDRVIYMNINPSKEAVEIHDKFIDQLKTLHWLEWRKNDGKNKTFHCTVATKFKSNKFNDIWNFVSKYNPHFNLYFDNISILKWNNRRWETYREFKLS